MYLDCSPTAGLSSTAQRPPAIESHECSMQHHMVKQLYIQLIIKYRLLSVLTEDGFQHPLQPQHPRKLKSFMLNGMVSNHML